MANYEICETETKKRRNIAQSNYPSKYMYRVYNKVLYYTRFCRIKFKSRYRFGLGGLKISVLIIRHLKNFHPKTKYDFDKVDQPIFNLIKNFININYKCCEMLVVHFRYFFPRFATRVSRMSR